MEALDSKRDQCFHVSPHGTVHGRRLGGHHPVLHQCGSCTSEPSSGIEPLTSSVPWMRSTK